MKRAIAGILASLFALAASATTLNPVQLLNPTGSTSGQTIVSTGASSAPGWGNVPVTNVTGAAALSGATFTGPVVAGYSNPLFNANDTSSSNTSNYFWQKNGTTVWDLFNTSATGILCLQRYVGGTSTDSPWCVSNSTGLVTLVDGISSNSSNNAITGGAISGASVSATTLSASSTVSGTGFSTYLASPPAIGGTAAAAGSFTTLSSTGNFTPSQTNGIVGTTTNNSANAGSMGEYICAQVTNGGSPAGCQTNVSTPVSLTTGTPANITSISLTAGDWMVCGNITTIPAGSTGQTGIAGDISNVSASFTGAIPGTGVNVQSTAIPTGAAEEYPVGCGRVLLSATTTEYLVISSNFSTSTNTAIGYIWATRRR